MINLILKFFVKKYVASIVTDMLSQVSKKVDLDVWKDKIRNILQFCQLLLDKLDDNVITNEEIVEITEKAKTLVK